MSSPSQNFEKKSDPDLLLHRGQRSSKIETLFIIGNGAIENGDLPLSKTLKELQPEKFFIFNPELLGTIPSLSCISQFEKGLFDNLILHLKGALPELPSDGTSSGFELCTWKLCAYSYTFRKVLADSYRLHRDSLSVRDSIWRLLEDLGISADSSACLTTNWDDVLWRRPQIKNIAHLHGHCEHPTSLILPTETISEKALKGILINETKEKLDELTFKEKNKKITDTIKHFYSVSADSIISEMFGVENLFREWLVSANTIVIAGVRFNDYDHELMSTIAKHANRKKYKIVIVNRAKDPKDEKTKVDRVAGLFSCQPSDITFLNSDALEKNFSGTFNLRIPPELHAKLSIQAKSSGLSLNSYVTEKLKL